MYIELTQKQEMKISAKQTQRWQALRFWSKSNKIFKENTFVLWFENPGGSGVKYGYIKPKCAYKISTMFMKISNTFQMQNRFESESISTFSIEAKSSSCMNFYSKNALDELKFWDKTCKKPKASELQWNSK